MLTRHGKRAMVVVLVVLATGWIASKIPAHALLENAVVKTVTRAIPGPNALAFSRGGDYGQYLYVVSRGTDIFRVDPNGRVEYFTTRRPGNGRIDKILFDETSTN